MLNWKIAALATGALMILPVSTFAAKSAAEFNNMLEIDQVSYLAHSAKHANMGMRGQRMEKLLQQLDLTPEQSQQIEAIQEQSRNDAEGLKQQLQTQRQEIQSLFSSDAPSEQLREKYQSTQDLRNQLGNERFETKLAIREILTTEQRTKAAELMQQHRGRRFGS
ncbi:MAG: Spy/CpxP family protein refolding chaperone [Cyanobacteria bacterium P01_A01_bin.40]